MMSDGRWRMSDGRRMMSDDRWRMSDGRWRMSDGRRMRDEFFPIKVKYEILLGMNNVKCRIFAN